jgi:hypothetical protein
LRRIKINGKSTKIIIPFSPDSTITEHLFGFYIPAEGNKNNSS